MHHAPLDASKYEILYDLPQGEYSDKSVGAIRTKTIRAGDSLEVEAFPLINADPVGRRALESEMKKRGTSAAQAKLNLENSRKKARRLLETNFTHGDIVLHPTYDYGFVNRSFANIDDIRREWRLLGYPEDEAEAETMIRNFIRRLKRRVKRKGGSLKDFKYIYVIESTCEPLDEDQNALPAHYHYHMVISSLGVLTIDDINELWQYGRNGAQLLDFRFNGLEALAKYIVKQPRRRSHYRKYRTSKNLQQPDIRVSDRKISRRRAALVARDVQADAKIIFESLYPDYALEDCTVKYSDFVAGAYIYARMRRRAPQGNRKTKSIRGGGAFDRKNGMV